MLRKLHKSTISILSIVILMLITTSYKADAYCTPPQFIDGPYTGVTNVSLNGVPKLDNSTIFNEGYIYFTDVAVPVMNIGSEYTFSITIIDQVAFTPLNALVYIDWNQDDDFDDEGEIAVTMMDIPAGGGTFTETIIPPENALTGITRMRVFEDMGQEGGHIAPEPCGYLNYPDHFLGHHGNVEDYDIIIEPATGVEENFNPANDPLLCLSPNPVNSDGKVNVSFTGEKAGEAEFYITDISGNIVKTFGSIDYDSGENEKEFNVTEVISGYYHFILEFNDYLKMIPLIITK